MVVTVTMLVVAMVTVQTPVLGKQRKYKWKVQTCLELSFLIDFVAMAPDKIVAKNKQKIQAFKKKKIWFSISLVSGNLQKWTDKNYCSLNDFFFKGNNCNHTMSVTFNNISWHGWRYLINSLWAISVSCLRFEVCLLWTSYLILFTHFWHNFYQGFLKDSSEHSNDLLLAILGKIWLFVSRPAMSKSFLTLGSTFALIVLRILQWSSPPPL